MENRDAELNAAL